LLLFLLTTSNDHFINHVHSYEGERLYFVFVESLTNAADVSAMHAFRSSFRFTGHNWNSSDDPCELEGML
jgi:hypothetical protein